VKAFENSKKLAAGAEHIVPLFTFQLSKPLLSVSLDENSAMKNY
jgi:hypothetical protein